MAREINVEEAASWDDQEAAENIQYLEVRARYPELARVKELRGEEAPAGGDEGEPGDLMDLKKDELLAMADERGLDASDSMTKAEIVDLLNA